jgi:nicotinate dehydrogenase subunit B
MSSELENTIEVAEHEAIKRLSYGFDLDRREFFKFLGGGLLVCLVVRPGDAQESGAFRHREQLPQSLDAWLHIAPDGSVTVFTGKVEMGQNIRTSLAQQVAEELHVPMASILLIMGITDRTPFDMGTFGSRSTPTMGPLLRRVAANARELLFERAAQRWHAEKSTLSADDGKISNPRKNESVTYGDLVKGKPLIKVISEDIALIPAKDWQIAGTSVPKVDGFAFVTGKLRYTSDMQLPGMLYGKVLRPAAFHATLKSLESSAAEKIPGVTVVRDGNFIGVVGPDEATATRAVRALRAEWNAPKQPSEDELFDYIRKHPDPEAVAEGRRGGQSQTHGSLEQGYKSAQKTLQQTYTVAYIAHAPLEPRAAVAEWKGGQLTVWTGTQRPFAVSDELAQAFRIPAKDARVAVPDTGSAYGGKHTGETAIEAARLAKAVNRPVKLVWTREEEFTWAYFRPAGVIDAKAGLRNDGVITAWEFDNYNSGPAAIGTPYDIPNQRIEFHAADSPLRQGSYRGLAATANHFARESFMDELAHAVGMDPLEFRLKNLADDRLKAVFTAAAEKFGWGKEKSSPTRGFGIGGGIEKGGHVATCAEVEIDTKTRQVRIVRVVEAWECGAVINPDGLRNQIAGAIVQGIGGALFEAIHFDNGRILNPHFASYRVPRFSDVPAIEIVVLDRKDLPPAGAGETPLMGLAPAVGNAIFAATGQRLRSLPMVPEGLPASS